MHDAIDVPGCITGAVHVNEGVVEPTGVSWNVTGTALVILPGAPSGTSEMSAVNVNAGDLPVAGSIATAVGPEITRFASSLSTMSEAKVEALPPSASVNVMVIT